MKKLLALFLIFSATSAFAEGKHYQAVVEGMHWKVGCSTKVRGALEKLEQVKKASVDTDTKIADIYTKTEKDTLSKEEIIKSISSYPEYSVAEFKEIKE